jgi:hypothetical protein
MKIKLPFVCVAVINFLCVPESKAWLSLLDGSSLPQANGWTVNGADSGSVVALGGGNSGIRQSDDSFTQSANWSLANTNSTSTLGARFRIDSYLGGPLNVLQLGTANSDTNPSPMLAVGIRGGRFYFLRALAEDNGAPPEEARLADLGAVEEGVFNEAHLYIDNATKRVRLFWNAGLRYTGLETNELYLLTGPALAAFGASTSYPQLDRSGMGTITFDWIGFGDRSDLPLNMPFIAWAQYLDGSVTPSAPWQTFLDPAGAGTTEIVEFTDPYNGATNQAIRLTSNSGANEYYVGAFEEDETFAGARLVLREFSETGKENLFCVTTRSLPLAPCPSITLVDGRYKLWNYVESDTELLDIGPAVVGEFHTVYIYAHHEGYVRVWWDGNVIFDGIAPRTNPYQGYFEWGSGSWQFNASDMVDFDWVAYGAVSRPAPLTTTPAHGDAFQSPTNGFSFTIATDEGVATNAVLVRVNGVDRSGAVAISGTDTLRQGSLGGLVSNQFYQITVIFTNLVGATSSNLIVFDTFSQGNLTIEAEDWNFDFGQFIDDPVPASQTLPNSYFGRESFEDIDHEELNSSVAQHVYRDVVLVGTEPTGDVLRQKFIDAQVNDPAAIDYNVGWVEVTEWLNYTRTFPSGTFNIYGRFANGNLGETFVAALDKVDDATITPQTTTPVGVFLGRPGRGWQTYDFVPLTDTNGTILAVTMGGIETVRVTAVSGGYNANLYMFVPAAAPAPRLNIRREGGNLVVSWAASGYRLETAGAITGTWATVATVGNTHTFAPGTTPQFFRLAPN